MSGAKASRIAADYLRFKDLTYEGFRALARTEGLSRYQQIGFPGATMMRAPVEAFQVRVGRHACHVVKLTRHCERRNSR